MLEGKNGRATAVFGTMLGLAVAAPTAAQDAETSVLDSDDVRGIVAERVRALDATRSALDAFLGRVDVREAAQATGLDIERVRGAASALSDDEVRTLAPRLAQTEEALAGGASVVISTTAIIIGLLVLILILVA
jgi:hypothetical protein